MLKKQKNIMKKLKALGKDKFTIELMTYDKDTAKRDAEYFKEQLEKNLDGVTIKIKQQPFKQKLDLVSKVNMKCHQKTGFRLSRSNDILRTLCNRRFT